MVIPSECGGKIHPQVGGVGRPLDALLDRVELGEDQQQHERAGRGCSESMLRRLPGLGRDVLRSAGFPRAKGEGIYLKV